MKKKIILSTFLILNILFFGIFAFFISSYNKVYADSNLDKVNFQYSDNFSTSGMPDYNRFILDSNSFFDNNSISGVTYDYNFQIEGWWHNSRMFVKLAYYDYYFNTTTEAQDYYNSVNGTGDYEFYIRINYYNNFYLLADLLYYCELNNKHVYVWAYCRPDQLHLNNSNYEFTIDLNNNFYDCSIKNIPINFSTPQIYIEFTYYNQTNINIGYDCWGYSSIRNDYIIINYDVFSYYYFKYGDIEELTRSFYASPNFSFRFKSATISNIVVDYTLNTMHWGWHTDTGVILNRVNFNSGSNWVSYFAQPHSASGFNFRYSFSFYYYVSDNLVNTFNGTNENFNSTDLYRQDVQWYDIFGHLYNFLIYLIFDMPLISNITQPIYFIINSAIVTIGWVGGVVAGLGIFGAFGLVYLLFTIIRRNI